jgi:hypothetical protein
VNLRELTLLCPSEGIHAMLAHGVGPCSRLQTYRAFLPRAFKQSLDVTSEEYDEIKAFTLLELNKIPKNLLELIWHERK